MKKIEFVLIAIAVMSISGCQPNMSAESTEDPLLLSNESLEDIRNQIVGQSGSIHNTSGLCGVFDQDEIARITGFDIVSAEVYEIRGTEDSSCRYYVSGKKYAPVLSIGKYKGDAAIEKAKYGKDRPYEKWRILSQNKIGMDNFVAYNEVQQLSDIYLMPKSGGYYRLTLYSLQAVKSYQMIDLAAEIAIEIGEE